MIRPPRTQRWPDLVYKSERLAEATSHNRLQERTAFAEAEFIKHLRDDACPDCRKKVAMLARSGAKLSSAILQAAGVEVLN